MGGDVNAMRVDRLGDIEVGKFSFGDFDDFFGCEIGHIGDVIFDQNKFSAGDERF